MAARRCAECGILYPVGITTGYCDIHDTALAYIPWAEPDKDWEEKAQAAKVRHAYLEKMRPKVEKESGGLDVPEVTSSVTERDGGIFLDVHEIIRGGYANRLNPTDLVKVGEQVYEVLEYCEEHRQYWVRPFSTELSEADLKWLANRRRRKRRGH